MQEEINKKLNEVNCCSMCYTELSSDNLDSELMCPNNHSDKVCKHCFLKIQKCPICRTLIKQTRKLNKLRRTFWFDDTKNMILEINEKYREMRNKFLSNEIQQLYEDKMFTILHNMKHKCIRQLEGQAKKIIDQKFLKQTKQDFEDLKQIDQYILELNGSDKFKQSNLGKIMLKVSEIEERKKMEIVISVMQLRSQNNQNNAT